MKTRIRILILLLALAAVAAAVLRSGWIRKEDPNVIRLSGNIEMTQVDVSFKVAGKIVELNVTDGSTVKKGDVIARLDRASVERQRTREQAGLTSAEAALQQAQTAVAFQRESIDGDVALKKADVEQAQSRLQELLNGSRPQEIQQAKAALDDAHAWNEQAKRDWERAQTLYKNEDISTQQYDQFRARAQSTSMLLKQAEDRLSLVQEGPRKEQIEQARAQLERAKAALRLSEANRLELKRRQEEVGARRAEIDRQKAQIAVVDAQLDDTVSVAPVDGVVLVKNVEIGEVVAAGTTLVSIGELDRPWVRGYINEKDLGRVKLGMKVKVTTDSYPGKVYAGRITFISSEAEFTPKQIQTQEERVKLVYRLKIECDNPQRELKVNMPVDAVIQLAQ